MALQALMDSDIRNLGRVCHFVSAMMPFDPFMARIITNPFTHPVDLYQNPTINTIAILSWQVSGPATFVFQVWLTGPGEIPNLCCADQHQQELGMTACLLGCCGECEKCWFIAELPEFLARHFWPSTPSPACRMQQFGRRRIFKR